MMKASIESVEENLIASGKLTKDQIDQIREIFIMIDVDKSGTLSYEEVAKLLSQLSQNSINKDEAIKIIEKMDLNKDGTIEWTEFLQAIYEWLESIGALKEGQLGDESNSVNERKKFHLKLANFFLQFNQDKNLSQLKSSLTPNSEDLEGMPEFWNFLGVKTYYSQEEKWQYYNDFQNILGNFSSIAQKINSAEYETCLSAVQDLVKLLNIVSVFQTPGERFEIANQIIRVFDLFENSSCLERVIEFLNKSDDPMLVWESLKAVTIFSAGPRIANTPENSNLHPDRFYHRAILVQKDIVPLLLKFVSSQCVEVKRQAVLAIGFLCRGCADIRDFIVSLGGASNLLELVDEKMDLEDGISVSWTLSILSGNTIINPSVPDISLALDLVKAFTFFLYWKDDTDIIVNSMLGLSFLLPLVELNMQNQDLWKRIIMMVTHNAIIVKRAAMKCLRKIILNNDLQAQFLVENGVIMIISDLLNYNNTHIKCEACDIVSVLASKGYTWPILENSGVITNLARMVYEDAELRWAAVKVFKSLSCVAGEFNKILLSFGVMKTIFANLSSFKDYDKVLKDIYGYLEPSYNFAFLIDSLRVLNNLMTTTAGIADVNGFINEMTQQLELANFEKLRAMMEMFFNDIELHKIPLIQINKNYNDVCLAISETLDNYLVIFQNANVNDYTRKMIDTLVDLKSKLADLEPKFKDIIANYAIFNSNNKLQIRCFSNENLSGGDNRTIDDIPLNISLLELLLIIEQKYMKSPIVLHYIDETNEKVPIEDEKQLSRALEKAIFEHQKKGATGPILFEVIVASPMIKGLRNYVLSDKGSSNLSGKMYDLFQGYQNSTNLFNKDSLLEDLRSKTNLDKFELEQIYNSFVQVTTKRFQNKSDGSVNFQEFNAIMKNYVNDADLVSELFNSIDVQKKGEIDFRDFVCALSILKGGSLEDKLRLAFMAYDVNHNGFIDKSEMFQLLRASSSSKGMNMPENELWDAVNKVFSTIDKNNDGYLSYTEFKTAVLNHHLLINPFWTNPYLLKIFNKKPW